MKKKIFKTVMYIGLVCSLLMCGCGGNENFQEKTQEPKDSQKQNVVESNAYAIHMTINPDVYFIVDEQDEVIGVLPQNTDAEYVCLNLDFTNLSLETVLLEWVSKCEEMGYDINNMKLEVVTEKNELVEKVSHVYEELCDACGTTASREVRVSDTTVEMPTCKNCGELVFSSLDTCANCSYEPSEEYYQCFCGTYMEPDKDLCPSCHLYNSTGQYEDGWGPNGREIFKCFCGEEIDSNATYCPYCHLNNATGEYEVGWGPEGEVDTALHCIYCDSTNVIWGTRPCDSCGGTKQATCFQCGGSGTDYVTAAGETTGGWYETCSNCNGTGKWECQKCKKHPPQPMYICKDCDGDWSVEE